MPTALGLRAALVSGLLLAAFLLAWQLAVSGVIREHRRGRAGHGGPPGLNS